METAKFEAPEISGTTETLRVVAGTVGKTRHALAATREPSWDSFFADAPGVSDSDAPEITDAEFLDVLEGRACLFRGEVRYLKPREKAKRDFGTLVTVLSFLERNGVDLRNTKRSVFKGMEELVSQAAEERHS